jgi:hypothetical protein
MINLRNCAKVVGVCALFTLLAMNLPAQSAVVVANPTDIAKALGVQSPFAVNAVCGATYTTNGCDIVVHVPLGVRWVIKNLSVRCDTPINTNVVVVEISTTAGGTFSAIFPAIPASRVRPPIGVNLPPTWVMTLSQVTEIYADPGTAVAFTVNLDSLVTYGHLNADFEIQGQAISVP